MVFDVLVQFRHECALAIPFVRPDDVYAGCLECIGRAHHGSDVEVMRPVLHGDFELMTAMRVKIGLDGRDGPIAVAVKHIATIACIKQG